MENFYVGLFSKAEMMQSKITTNVDINSRLGFCWHNGECFGFDELNTQYVVYAPDAPNIGIVGKC